MGKLTIKKEEKERQACFSPQFWRCNPAIGLPPYLSVITYREKDENKKEVSD